jgi:hypothetical protein
VEACRLIGNPDAPLATTMVDALAKLGYGLPRYYRQTDHLLRTAAAGVDPGRWDNAAGLWVTASNIPGGEASAALDGAGGDFRDWGYNFDAAHLPVLRFQIETGSIHADAGRIRFGFEDVAAGEGWGFVFDPAVDPEFYVEAMVGGVPTLTAVSAAVVAGTTYEVELAVVYDPTGPSYDLRCTVDGNVTNVVAGLSSPFPVGRRFNVGAGGVGAVGTFVLLRRLVTEADFGV